MFLESFAIKVSLAIRLVDDFSRAHRPVGEVRVSLQNRVDTAIENPGDYDVFLDLPAGNFVVQVRSPWYFDEDHAVTLPRPDPLNPLITITLKPRWLYPFPANATLIRGQVQNSGGEAVPNALVRLMQIGGKTVKNRTAEDGRFVLYVTGLSEDDVVDVAQGRALRATDGSTSFQLMVTHPSFQTNTVAIQDVMEGKAHFLANPISLQA